jgi:hypothetical protein
MRQITFEKKYSYQSRPKSSMHPPMRLVSCDDKIEIFNQHNYPSAP